MPGPRGIRGGAKAKNAKATILRLIKYLFKYYKVYLTIVAICILFSAFSGTVSSLFLNKIVLLISEGLDKGYDAIYADLLGVIMTMIGLYVVGIASSFIYTRLMAIITQGFLNKMRQNMFGGMQSLPIKYFDTHTHGDIMSYYTNDIDTLRQLISQSIPQLFTSALTILALVCYMLYLSVWMTLLVFVGVVAMALVTKKVGGNSAKYFVKQQKSIGVVEGYIEEMMNGQKVVKVFCHEEKAKERFAVKNENLGKTAAMANTLANILMPATNNLGFVLYVVIAVVGGAMGIAGVTNLSIGGEAVLTLGTIASFLTLSRNFINPIAQVSQQLNSVIMAMAGASRIFELLDEAPEEDKGTVTLVNVRTDQSGGLCQCSERTGHWAWKDGDKLIPMKGRIDLNDVDFGYNDDELVLHDICIYAEPGQKIALVGATGAGKTTITNLINRFYDIDDGKIQYDGININRIKKFDLRRSLGVVLQDVNLFTGTVMENIRYGRLDATDEECIAAARLANADGFIRMLPEGYDTVLEGDGSGLSQGQRQLISIARAAVADPPVMILDEATSSIDTRTESIVQKGMDNLMHGRTVFIIAHRLSTIQNSDVIMVMDHGRIIERGNHEQLIEKKGRYYQLYTGAFELE